MDSVLLEMLCAYSGDPDDLLSIEGTHLSHGSSYEAQGASVQGPGGRTAEASSNGIGSGRYRKGEGENSYQHGTDNMIERAEYYRKHGMKDPKDLAKAFGFLKPDGTPNVSQYRKYYSKELHKHKLERAEKARKLLESGMSKKAVAAQFGIRDTSLTSWLNQSSLKNVKQGSEVADFLEEQIKQKKAIYVGAGVEKELGISGISKDRLKEALMILEERGYQRLGGRVPQATNPGNKTSINVIADKDVPADIVYKHPELIKSVTDYVYREGPDGESKFEPKWRYPASMDSSRLMIRYRDDVAPDGHTGIEKDGTIELRRNVPDLDLQGSKYSQVRILVDGNRYLKGVAHYSDNMPDGVDVIFNTNKQRGEDVLKKIKETDPNNPFGALLREDGGQYTYKDKNGEEKLGLINKTRQEGDWEEWKNSLSSQFLAKQPMELINKQLGLAVSDKKAELNDIMNLTNPTVKRKMLLDFAESCDSDAVDMRAAQLPRQKYQVILPVPTLNDNEVYAPNFKPGETIALIRFPHQGLFEIPILKVNNSNPQGKEIMGSSPIDAIGLNKKNADLLSGADFDGDTVMCVPCNDPRFSDTKIMNQPPLKGLEDFDPKVAYKAYRTETRMEKVSKKDKYGHVMRDENNKIIYEEKKVEHYFREDGKEFKPLKRTGFEMGVVSNLMMDATLKGATDEHKAMIARHCQVIIDAEKHHLDWKQSEKDNHIDEMKRLYQKSVDENGEEHIGGASTVITRAGSPTRITKPTGQPHIDPKTGKLFYKEDQLKPQTYKDYKTGKILERTIEVDRLMTKDDAFELVDNPNNAKEVAYARYANTLRALANEARKASLTTGDIAYNKQAAEKYSTEVDELDRELLKAELNAPREAMAQLYCRGIVLAMKRDNPDMTRKEIKKANNRYLAEGRIRYNAHRHKIDITPRQWEAIQSGAIKKTTLTSILKYADPDKVREYATPRSATVLTVGQKARIRNALNDGRPAAVLAEQFHVSVSTINNLRKEKG